MVHSHSQNNAIYRTIQKTFLVALLFMVITLTTGYAEETKELKLASIFGDNMVLQRDMKIPVWGWASPGQTIEVLLDNKKEKTKADNTGQWEVHLPAFPAGGPYKLIVKAQNTIILSNILIGEVWLSSGQSNMEWPLAWSENADAVIAQATWPKIRIVKIPHQATAIPQTFMETSGWQACNPESIGNFSAVAYFFGRELRQDLDVPIGLIDNSWGGSSMEAWTPLEVLESDPDFTPAVEQFREWEKLWLDLDLRNEYERLYKIWKEQTGGNLGHTDPGRQPETEHWAELGYNDNAWATIDLPGMWEEALPLTDGVVWFRKTIDIPADWEGKEVVLRLGSIDDLDTTYFNGVEVGHTGLETPNAWTAQREYAIHESLVKAGQNVVTVRVMDTGGPGGFGGPAENMMLALEENLSQNIQLAGPWRYKVAVKLQQQPTTIGQGAHQVPTALYNGMLHPLMPFAIRGIIWYQGESNLARWDQYLKLSDLMITSWRKRWGQGNIPFLLCQLSAMDVDWPGWPELREAQLQTLEQPNTAMAVTVDIGASTDIHPRNKLDVGHRLALAARAKVYGEKIVYSGPIYRSMKIKGNLISLKFNHAGSGLMTKNGEELKGFVIAGSDGKFFPAHARIDGKNRVIVSSKEVPNPTTVRYAWANFPDANLYNLEGLPASPFRTDPYAGKKK